MSDPKKKDQLLGHAADNDGIDEYDNPLPDWWLGMFVFCVVWAIGYTVDYHFISQRSQEQYYVAEMEEAKVRWPQQAVAAAADISDETVAKGADIFKQNCVGCHGAELQGGIGPNLTDATWIHGGSLAEIRTTITNGVPEKGMLTWGPILGPEKVAQVAAFVYSKGPKLGLEPAAGAGGTGSATPSDDGTAGGEGPQGAVEQPAAAGTEG